MRDAIRACPLQRLLQSGKLPLATTPIAAMQEWSTGPLTQLRFGASPDRLGLEDPNLGEADLKQLVRGTTSNRRGTESLTQRSTACRRTPAISESVLRHIDGFQNGLEIAHRHTSVALGLSRG